VNGHQIDILQIITALGLPAAISGILVALMKALFDARQRKSKESLSDWLAQPSATDPFKGDDRALRALHELQQTLIFERAFGLKAESGVRNELLLFAESQHESMALREVLDAGRFVPRLPLAQLSKPKQIKTFKVLSRIAKPTAYLCVTMGYILFVVSLYALMYGDRKDWLSDIGGLVIFGGMTLLGFYNFKTARRCEIITAFLGWLSESQSSSAQVQSERLPGENDEAGHVTETHEHKGDYREW
jgi:hypothetical protein